MKESGGYHAKATATKTGIEMMGVSGKIEGRRRALRSRIRMVCRFKEESARIQHWEAVGYDSVLLKELSPSGLGIIASKESRKSEMQSSACRPPAVLGIQCVISSAV